MMTIEKLRESMKDPIVKDRALVRKAIEEMAQLPTAKWCKASVILTKSKEKLGTHILKNVADALGILPQDERIDTLGKLAAEVSHLRQTDIRKYTKSLEWLSQISSFFGLPRREDKKP